MQILGYWIYIKKSMGSEIEPNPSTWLMFAYGVLILGILEFDRGASLHILLLPGICAICAIVVALMLWRRGKLKWPNKWEEKLAFVIDVFLTVGYVTAWCLEKSGILSPQTREICALVFLVCSNLTAISSFYPLLHEVRADPRSEHPYPWSVWTVAYVTLAFATYFEEETWMGELMLYPALNAVLHGSVAWYARKRRPQPKTAH